MPRKTDRRTLYTVALIKNAFLDLEKELPYEKISVKKVCDRAEISRATFYLHFASIDEVLDSVLDDALMFSEGASGNAIDLIDIVKSGHISRIKEDESVLPACQRIADDDRYHDLFMDPALSEHIIMRIHEHEKGTVVPEIMKKTGFDEGMAEMIFQFMLYGPFYVNRRLGWNKDKRWFEFQETLNTFLDAGMRSIARDGSMIDRPDDRKDQTSR